MLSTMNKHGYVGVRKRTDYAFRRRPYYARFAIKADQFVYSPNFATAEEAAAAYDTMKAAHRLSLLPHISEADQ